MFGENQATDGLSKKKIILEKVAEEPVLSGPRIVKPIKFYNTNGECVVVSGSGIEGPHNSNPEVINLPETSTDMSEQASDDDVTDKPVTIRSTS